MKKILLSCFLLFFIIGALTAQQLPEKGPSEMTSLEKNLQATVSFLSSDSLRGRLTGTPDIEKAAQYLEKALKKAGLKPYFKTYRDSFQFRGRTGYNIVAYKEGTDPNLKNELVVLGAHYDHIGIQKPVKGDSIANGANDDASGTAVLLELAKHFAKENTKRSLLFSFFSAEELGLGGSHHLAERLYNRGAHLYAMLNFEMLGVPLKNRDYSAYLTGYQKSNLAKLFNQYAGKKVLGFWDGAKKFRLFKRSDNYSFYKFSNIPAHTLSSFDFQNFHEYHKVGDELDLVNFPFMAKFTLNSIPAIRGIVNAPQKEIKLNE